MMKKRIHGRSMPYTPLGRRHGGVSLIEYALIGTSVVMLCIVSFMQMSGNLKSWLDIFTGEAKSRIENVSTQQQMMQSEKAQYEAAITRAAKAHIANIETKALNSSGSGSLCSDNWCVNAPGLTGTTVATAGGNGSQIQLTNSAASIYSQIAKILEEQGADASTITLLTNMANQGHSLGENQAIFTGDSDFSSMQSSMSDFQSGLGKFQQMNQQLLSVLPKLPPDTRGILQDASNVIIGIGNSYDLTVESNNVNWHFTSSNISLTHANSNKICANGGDTSACMQ